MYIEIFSSSLGYKDQCSKLEKLQEFLNLIYNKMATESHIEKN